MNFMANSIEKVRILVVGDSGVGKTCLTHLIAHNESLTRPGWTVGCNIEVKLHDYKEGTPKQQIYFIELFDIGGSLVHKNTRSVFYAPTHGIILVHDLTNRRSQENLREWLYEILNKDAKDTYKAGTSSDSQALDAEQFLGATQIPILVVGTKLDLMGDKQRQPKVAAQKAGGIADQCSAEEIWLNCCDSRSLAPGTTDAVKLTRFFDRVIEKKSNVRYDSNTYSSFDRRRQQVMTASSPLVNPESLWLLGEDKTSTPKITGNVLLQGQVL